MTRLESAVARLNAALEKLEASAEQRLSSIQSENSVAELSLLKDERERALPLRTPAEAVDLLEPVAEALALAHRLGIAHRDVKPPNIFILGEPREQKCSVKLLDFGIAKVVQDAQKASG